MAEVIGLASGILAFASASIAITVSIVELINGFKDAPQTICDLQDNLFILRTVLEKLANSEQLRGSEIGELKRKNVDLDNLSDYDETDAESDVTKAALKQCNKVLKRMDDVLRPMRQNLSKGKLKASWTKFSTAAMDNSIQNHFEQLERAKSNLILALTFDLRFAVVNNNAKPNTILPQVPANNAGSAPPAYSQLDPQPGIKRRDSEISRAARRGMAFISKLKPGSRQEDMSGHNYESKSPTGPPSFGDIISSTIQDMSQAMSTDGEKGENGGSGGYDLAMLEMLWKSDFGRIQSLWRLDLKTVTHLKVFLASLKASTTTNNDVNDPAPSTLQWVDNNEQFKEWQTTDESKLLILEGKAGSGKSVLTKTIRKKAKDTASSDTTVLSYFCNNRMRPAEACTNILKAFICQYLRENKSDFTTLAEECASMTHDWKASTIEKFLLKFDVLLDIFSTILRISEKKTIYCIVDAIDECERDDDEMEKFTNQLKDLVKNQSGTAVKFYVSTRPDWIKDLDVDFSLASISPLRITLKPELTGDDIAQVVELELLKLETRITLDPEERAVLKEKLIYKAEGMMLWVVLAFREITKKTKKKLVLTLKWVKDMVDKLPLEIFGMYDHIMAGIKKKYGEDLGDEENSADEEEDESDLMLLRRLIVWVARARRPLTVKELQYALAVDMSDTCLKDTAARVIPNLENVICRIPFLEILDEKSMNEMCSEPTGCQTGNGRYQPSQSISPGNTVRFIHHTAKEYVLQMTDSTDNSNPANLSRVRSSDQNWLALTDLTIGRLCIRFLSFKDFECGPLRKFPAGVRFVDGFRSFIEDHGFLEYAASFWSFHLEAVPDLDDDTKELISFWACELKNNLRLWCQLSNFLQFGEHTDFIDNYFGLHVVAGSGITPMVTYFIDRGDDLNKRDELGRTPYMMASFLNCDACAKLLEDAGADTCLEFPHVTDCVVTDFQELLFSGDIEAIQKAIDDGADVNELDNFGRTALFYACFYLDEKTVDLLLKANTDLSIQDKYGRVALDVALDPSIRKMVLDKMKEKEMKCTPEMLKKIPCDHTRDSDYCCDLCGRDIHTFFYRE
ncbi:hypothetical protein ABW20_dc0102263 [Dactylellina cionopaga]|nr:hypothetical protein ABW20_dc0102263 [Dactylellina cionopaga]